MSRVISSSEVKNHRHLNDLWLIIHNDVYDVTKFTEEHPGGADSLLEVAGIDGTEAFEDAGHSSDARTLMKKYKIGTLPASEHTKYPGTWEQDSNKWLYIAAAAAIAIVIIAVVAKNHMDG